MGEGDILHPVGDFVGERVADHMVGDDEFGVARASYWRGRGRCSRGRGTGHGGSNLGDGGGGRRDGCECRGEGVGANSPGGYTDSGGLDRTEVGGRAGLVEVVRGICAHGDVVVEGAMAEVSDARWEGVNGCDEGEYGENEHYRYK